MTLERIIEGISWIVCAGLLWAFIPKNKIREAHVAFFFKQFMTWLFGLMVVQYHLIQYPIRFFSEATRASFTFEYFVYPSLCALFNIHYPEKDSFGKRLRYYIYYATGITVFEVILEVYTDLIEYTGWTWYWTWITLFLTLILSRWYFTWFFHKNKWSI